MKRTGISFAALAAVLALDTASTQSCAFDWTAIRPAAAFGGHVMALETFDGGAGTALSFQLAVPPDPSLAGLAVALQAANVALFTPGTPLELSNALTGAIGP